MHSSLGTVDSGVGLVFWETSSVESVEPGEKGADCCPEHPLSPLCAGALRVNKIESGSYSWKYSQLWLSHMYVVN